MSRVIRDKIHRQLEAATGYLALGLPLRALEILESRADWGTMQFEASFYTGEALRALERHKEALRPLELAAKLRPNEIGVAIALGWCYKRTHRLAQAIDALERASRQHPEEGLLRYNLACYWSLAGKKEKALEQLAEALRLDPDLRQLVPVETDFDGLRNDPAFQDLVAGPAPLA